ncbi:MAG TPA: SHOCT domain-containing protein [Nitrosopumilaceae archaeon]|nr:SHOCT domain-containing protein [Nitrosopumilaceae archaeon]
MSEDLIKTVQNLIDSKKGDRKRLNEILDTLKQGTPLYLSDYRYVESLNSKSKDDLKEDSNLNAQQNQSKKIERDVGIDLDDLKPKDDDDAMTILRTRLANGEISIEEFRTIKKALQDNM